MTDSKKSKSHDPKKDSEIRSQDSANAEDLEKKVGEAQKKDSEVRNPSYAKASEGRQDSAKAEDESKSSTGSVSAEKKIEPSFAKASEAQLTENTKRIEELTNHLARCMADLQNYRRRSEEDKGRFVKFANAEMLKVLLPAIENLDRSCKHLPEALKEDAWSKGVLHTQSDLAKALDKIGVKRIETIGKKMDLKFHEVLMTGPGEKEMITEELDPGYTLNGETIKAAKVKVGDGTKT